MPDETLKEFWNLMTQLRRNPSQGTYALAIKLSTTHPNGKARTAIQAFLNSKRETINDQRSA